MEAQQQVLGQGLYRGEIFQGKLGVRGVTRPQRHIWPLPDPLGVIIVLAQAKPLCLAKDWGSPANPGSSAAVWCLLKGCARCQSDSPGSNGNTQQPQKENGFYFSKGLSSLF